MQDKILQSPHLKLNSTSGFNNDENNSSLKCSSVVSEYHHLANSTLVEETEGKYQKIVDELKGNHYKEINKYQDKIRFLTLKVETLEA